LRQLAATDLSMIEAEDPMLDASTVKHDIDVMLWSMNLQKVRRFFHQRFWETETRDAEYASRVEPFPRLESVAEHSWHVADTVMLLGRHFASLNVNRCICLALMHDKMEMITGDQNPVGRDGTGGNTHAFNIKMRDLKDLKERQAVNLYLTRLSPDARGSQGSLLLEMLDGKTREALFVKAIDKLQAFCFVLLKKRGIMEDKHLEFTLQYSRKTAEYWPGLSMHYEELRGRFMKQVARRRNLSVKALEEFVEQYQLSLPL
jgi:5'-deoxynucleotidase YfbR-like HD superfamily hydrolase